MNPLEQRNALVNQKNELKAKLEGAGFMEALEIKDQILEIEKALGEATLHSGDSEECEMCGS